jgi:hypothetical protein
MNRAAPVSASVHAARGFALCIIGWAPSCVINHSLVVKKKG